MSKLDSMYNYQYAFYEKVSLVYIGKNAYGKATFSGTLKNDKPIKETMHGWLIDGTKSLNFFIFGDKPFSCNTCGDTDVKVLNVDVINNKIVIEVEGDVLTSPHLIVNYEYEMTESKPFVELKSGYGTTIKINDASTTKLKFERLTDGKEIDVATFNTFFSSKQLNEIYRNAETKLTANLPKSIDNSHLYSFYQQQCLRLTNLLVEKGAAGYFWVAAHEHVCDTFRSASGMHNFVLDYSLNTLKPWGVKMPVEYLGVLAKRWRLYCDTNLPLFSILIGCNDKLEDWSHYGVINFKCDLDRG